MLDLVLLDGSGKQYAIPEGGELHVGTGAHCTVRLAAEDVSRHHALVADRGGRVVLLDLGSKNGTYLNGRRVREAEVVAGDVVRFSSVAAQFLRHDEGEGAPRREACAPEPTPRLGTATDDAIPLALPPAINELLDRWRHGPGYATAALVLWLVERRGMRGAAVVDPGGDELTVVASHGAVKGVLHDARFLRALSRCGPGFGVETSQLLVDGERVLTIGVKEHPCLVTVTGDTVPDACEVELWANLLVLASRLDGSAASGSLRGAQRRRTQPPHR